MWGLWWDVLVVAIPIPDESPEHRDVWLPGAPDPEHPKMCGIPMYTPINCHLGLCAGSFCPQVRFGAFSKEQVNYLQGDRQKAGVSPQVLDLGGLRICHFQMLPWGLAHDRHYDFQCV